MNVVESEMKKSGEKLKLRIIKVMVQHLFLKFHKLATINGTIVEYW